MNRTGPKADGGIAAAADALRRLARHRGQVRRRLADVAPLIRQRRKSQVRTLLLPIANRALLQLSACPLTPCVVAVRRWRRVSGQVGIDGTG